MWTHSPSGPSDFRPLTHPLGASCRAGMRRTEKVVGKLQAVGKLCAHEVHTLLQGAYTVEQAERPGAAAFKPRRRCGAAAFCGATTGAAVVASRWRRGGPAPRPPRWLQAFLPPLTPLVAGLRARAARFSVTDLLG